MRSWTSVILLAATTTTEFGVAFIRTPLPLLRRSSLLPQQLRMTDKPAGSFFNKIPERDDSEKKPEESIDFDKQVADLLAARTKKGPPPSTVGGVPINGFSVASVGRAKPYIGLGPPDVPANDPTRPEYDDQGYTLYKDETTGQKARVFEALVEYPCDFTLKIVGPNEGSFVAEIVQCVADSCEVKLEQVPYTTRDVGKWTSVTVKAPVQNADMLYQLYENVDRDPRVKFKF